MRTERLQLHVARWNGSRAHGAECGLASCRQRTWRGTRLRQSVAAASGVRGLNRPARSGQVLCRLVPNALPYPLLLLALFATHAASLLELLMDVGQLAAVQAGAGLVDVDLLLGEGAHLGAHLDGSAKAGATADRKSVTLARRGVS